MSSRPSRTPRFEVSVTAEGVRSPVAPARLAALAEAVLRAERVPRARISIALLTAPAMARLNRTHLGHRGATDVITFALGDDGAGVLTGDIYICPEVARRQALEWGVGIREELARLVVHGCLHACGWDHPVDAAREQSAMWRRQERLLARWWTAVSAPA
ncbi:MAG: rRNA maturation RNase YbeY [Gemmatimonadaceae bacterium]|nr:rRNA maturation RNase YbeY [Gemmatimonadaceae bacterium]